MDLLNFNTLGNCIGYGLSNLTLKKITIEVVSAQGQAADAAFKLNDLLQQGLVKTFSVTSEENGVMSVEAVFAETAPVQDGQYSQDDEEAPVQLPLS